MNSSEKTTATSTGLVHETDMHVRQRKIIPHFEKSLLEMKDVRVTKRRGT